MAMTLRPTEEQESALARLARAWGVSKQAAALRAIEEAAARQSGEIETLARQSLAQYGPLYDKLSRT